MGNKSTVVNTLLENGTFKYLTSYSISFASSINYLVACFPHFLGERAKYSLDTRKLSQHLKYHSMLIVD